MPWGNMQITNRNRLLVPLLAGLVAGCGTTKEARNLALETATAVQTLDVALSRNIETGKKNADQTAATIRTLMTGTAELQADLQAEIDVSQAKAEYLKLREFADTQEANRLKTLAAAEAAANAAADARQQWTAPTALLKQVSGNLTELGKEENRSDRLKFAAAFVKEVAGRVKQASDAAKADSEKAQQTAADKGK